MSFLTQKNFNGQEKSRFPRLQECSHFHYDVNILSLPKNFEAIMWSDDNQDENSISKLSNSFNDTSYESYNETNKYYCLKVTSNNKKWTIFRTYENFCKLDTYLHNCIFDRKYSCLEELLPGDEKNHQHYEFNLKLQIYLARFFEIVFTSLINCSSVLNWFEVDNKGNRLLDTESSFINTPGVAVALVRKRFESKDFDEISLDVGNIISVIDMPGDDESIWWCGKNNLEVNLCLKS